MRSPVHITSLVEDSQRKEAIYFRDSPQLVSPLGFMHLITVFALHRNRDM